MNDLLPQAYLLGLIALLGVAAAVVGRQILRVRRDELALARLGDNSAGTGTPRDATTLYELASVQLRKRLYGQAQGNLKQALKLAEAENVPAEARALMENALGFALAAQNNYTSAVRHYQAALRAKADYPVALNNLAFALEKQTKPQEARDLYQQVLELEPANRTARKRLALLDRRSGTDASANDRGKGIDGVKGKV